MSAKKMVIIVNPSSGTKRGLAILEQIKPIFSQGKIELKVYVTEHPGYAKEIASTLDLEGIEGFCVIGGDGTNHEVADGLMQRVHPITIPLGLIPAGTGNTVHQHLECIDPLNAARRIIAGKSCPLDVARVKMSDEVLYCVDIIGWGGVADINCVAERLRILGPPRYAVAALWHILHAKRRRARILLDGQIIEDEFLFVIACNTKFTGKGMKLAPCAEISDGKIDVVVLRKASRLQMIKLFVKVFDGSHLSMPCIEYHQVSSFAIESESCDPLDLDGEIKGTTPVYVEMLPAALRVFV